MEAETSSNDEENEKDEPEITIIVRGSDGFERLIEELDENNQQKSLFVSNLVGSLGVYDEVRKLSESIVAVSDLSMAKDSALLLSEAIQTTSPVLEFLDSANCTLSKILDSSQIIAADIDTKSFLLDSWNEKLAQINTLPEDFLTPQFVIDSHLSEIAKISVLIQSSASYLDWEHIGNKLGWTADFDRYLSKNVLDLTQAYSNLFDSFIGEDSLIASWPSTISKFPTIQLFNEISLLESITHQEDEDIELAHYKLNVKSEIQQVTLERLPTLLSHLDEGLVRMWHGARQSLESDNPERARHLTVSLRELFTHILHSLTPKDEIEGWLNRPENHHEQNFYNKKPTRRARLKYIYRNINHGSFTDFVDTDIESILKFLKIFQKGTHKIRVEFDDNQLHAMLVRMETTLVSLLEIGLNIEQDNRASSP